MTLPLLASSAPLRIAGWLAAALSLHLGLALTLRWGPQNKSVVSRPEITSLVVEVQFEEAPKETAPSFAQEVPPPLEPLKTRRPSPDLPRDAGRDHQPLTPAPEGDARELLAETKETAPNRSVRKAAATFLGAGDEPSGASGVVSPSLGNGGPTTGGGTSRRAPPRLLARSMRCADLYPYQAEADHALVAAEVLVSPTGHSQLNRIVRSTASELGFSKAARLCAKRLLFAPARDAGGRATKSLAIVRMTFERT